MRDKRNEEIRKMFDDGIEQKVIAQKFDISVRTVQRVCADVDTRQTSTQPNINVESIVESTKKLSIYKDNELIASGDTVYELDACLDISLGATKILWIQNALELSDKASIAGYEIKKNFNKELYIQKLEKQIQALENRIIILEGK